jgi:hypothetical protein
MNQIIEVSPRLEEWATLAGYTLTPASRTDDGRALFWSAGGETRLYIGTNDEDWFTIHDSHRMGAENFKFAARSMETIEKYLFGTFGEYIRSMRSLPDVHIPATEEEISPGFTIGMKLFERAERFALMESSGSVVAVTSGGRLIATMRLAALSLYITAPIDDIITSCLDPDGKPLFRRK